MTVDISDELRAVRRELDNLTYERTNRSWRPELVVAPSELELIHADQGVTVSA